MQVRICTRMGVEMKSTDFRSKDYYSNIRKAVTAGYFMQVCPPSSQSHSEQGLLPSQVHPGDQLPVPQLVYLYCSHCIMYHASCNTQKCWNFYAMTLAVSDTDDSYCKYQAQFCFEPVCVWCTRLLLQ